MKFIENAITVWAGSWANWVAAAASFIVGAFIQWHMAMFAFLAFLPFPFQIVGGGLILVILIAGPSSLARILPQKKLQDKLKCNKPNSAEAE